MKKRINHIWMFNHPLIFIAIVFWFIQLFTIFLLSVGNTILLSFVNFIIFVHLIIWLYVGKFFDKSDSVIDGMILPLVFLFIFLMFPTVINYLIGNIIKGIIWTYSWVFFGTLPVAIGVLYILGKIIKGAKLDDSFISRNIKIYKRCIFITTFFSFIMIFLIILSPLIVNEIFYNIADNQNEIRQLVSDLTKNSINDTDKTFRILKWFDRGVGKPENIANIYYRERDSDNEILLNVADTLYIFSKPPHFCSRMDSENSKWVFCSRCGRCGEFGSLFNTMADYANLTVRKAVCKGEDHVWNEVFINGEWIVIDSTAVNLLDSSGFNLTKSFMEDKVKGDLRSAGIIVEEGNVSYVYAIYPNAPNDKVDITGRYTNLTNVTILTIDSKMKPIADVEISVISNNRLTARDTELRNNTNYTGQCSFCVGGGDYTFKAKKEGKINLIGEVTYSFSENQSDYNINIKMENIYDGGKKMNDELFIQLLGLIGAIFLSFQVILGRVGGTKLRNRFANKISESRRKGKTIIANLYQTFFWSWERILGIIGFIFLLFSLVWTIILLV